MEYAQIGQLAKALALFQLDLPQVLKADTAKIEKKSGGMYSYQYADLADVSLAVLPALARHGLAWVCTLNAGVLTALLVHGESGEMVSSAWRVPDSDDPKAIGSQLTYGRRYLLMTMTGVHPAGEDDDGHAAVARQSGPPQQPAETPLVRLIRRGREAGHSDERIRVDLDDIAQGRQHVDLTADDLRPLFTRYTEELAAARARAEVAAQAGPPKSEPAPDDTDGGPATSEVDVDGVGSGNEENGAVPEDWPATAQPPTAAELANYDQGPATVDDGDPYDGADPDGDAVVDDQVEEEGASQEEVAASTSALEAARQQLNAQLAARKSRAEGGKR